MVASPPPPSDPSRRARSPILPRNVTTSRLELEQRLLATLDAIDEPIAIGSSVRDRDGRLLDFRFDDDLRAIRLGDGFLTTWRQRSASPEPG